MHSRNLRCKSTVAQNASSYLVEALQIFFLRICQLLKPETFFREKYTLWFSKDFIGTLWEFWWRMGKGLIGWCWNPRSPSVIFFIKKTNKTNKKPHQTLNFWIESRIKMILICQKHQHYFQHRLLRTGHIPVKWWKWLRNAHNHIITKAGNPQIKPVMETDRESGVCHFCHVFQIFQ